MGVMAVDQGDVGPLVSTSAAVSPALEHGVSSALNETAAIRPRVRRRMVYPNGLRATALPPVRMCSSIAPVAAIGA